MVFLVVILFGGIARLLLIIRSPGRVPLLGRFTTKQKMLVLGMVNIGFGAVGGSYVWHTDCFYQWEVFIGVLVITSLPEIAIRTGTATSKR